jgi:hypothetical protein
MARKATVKPPPAYDVHPGVAMVQKWAADLPAKTGHSLDEWADVLRNGPHTVRKDRVDWLKAEYGLGTVTAEQIHEYAYGQQTWEGDPDAYLANAVGYVEGMFGKGKEWQRPIFEAVVGFARTLGPDVKVCPCKTIIPLYRTRVFAELKPATRTRLELALALGKEPFAGRLQANPRAKGNDRLRRLIPLTEAKDFDAEVKKWLKEAYRRDAR